MANDGLPARVSVAVRVRPEVRVQVQAQARKCKVSEGQVWRELIGLGLERSAWFDRGQA